MADVNESCMNRCEYCHDPDCIADRVTAYGDDIMPMVDYLAAMRACRDRTAARLKAYQRMHVATAAMCDGHVVSDAPARELAEKILTLYGGDRPDVVENERLKAVQAELAALREVDRWIPVTEKLPAFEEECTITDGKVCKNAWYGGAGEGFYYDGELLKAIAWRPLPAPPKEEP